MSKRRWVRGELVEKIISRYKAGENQGQIAAALGLSQPGVSVVLRRHGVQPRSRGRARGTKVPNAKRTPILDRLLRFTPNRPEGECWICNAHRSGGYPQIQIGTLAEPHHVAAHRLSYEFFVGPIPEGKQVLHHCDVQTCINPRHLFLGTNADNMADKAAKGRAPHGEEVPSAKLTEDQVREIRRLFDSGLLNMAGAARLFGVSATAVHYVAHRRSWRHVDEQTTTG